MFEIDLEWPIASRYVVQPAKPQKYLWPGKRLLRPDVAIYPAEDATITSHRPLDHNPALYAEFAKLNGSERACLQFAHKYGLPQADLRNRAHYPASLETLRVWKAQIKLVRDIINRCELSRSNPQEAFRRFGKKDMWLFGVVELYLSVKSRNSPATLDVRPRNLFAAIQLQAIAAILTGRKSVQCIECSTPFEIGRGARRSQAKFCSTRCKDSYHNRLKAQARRMDHA